MMIKQKIILIIVFCTQFFCSLTFYLFFSIATVSDRKIWAQTNNVMIDHALFEQTFLFSRIFPVRTKFRYYFLSLFFVVEVIFSLFFVSLFLLSRYTGGTQLHSTKTAVTLNTTLESAYIISLKDYRNSCTMVVWRWAFGDTTHKYVTRVFTCLRRQLLEL